MKLLLENWRTFINEAGTTGRRLDRYATDFSREIIKALKDEDLRSYIESNGEATFTLVADLLEDLKWVRDIIVNVKISDLEDDHSIIVHGSYDWILDAPEEDRQLSDVYVNIEFPQLYTNKDFSELIPKLKETLRHELEHSGQPTEMLKKVYEKIPDKEIWKTLQTAKDYYTSESEVKGHVAGVYKRAKTEKQPIGELLDNIINEIYYTGLNYGYAEEELTPLVRRIRELWRYYLMSRYPHAKIELEPQEYINEAL